MHMVVFTSAEGKRSYHQADSLDEALKFVEHVRNSEGIEDARLFRMAEIPLQVRTYVKVELATSNESLPDEDLSGDGKLAEVTPAI